MSLRRTSTIAILALAACELGLGDLKSVGGYTPAFEASGVEVEVCDLDREPVMSARRFVALDDRALIEVRYSGGCKAHYFKLCWDEVIREERGGSVADLRLLHESNDHCEAAIGAILEFDLTPIRVLAGPDTQVLLRLAPGPFGAGAEEASAMYGPEVGSGGWCDPLGESCIGDHACVAVAGYGGPGFSCAAPAGDGGAGDSCWWSDCAPGLYCEHEPERVGCDPNLQDCCNPHCDLDILEGGCPQADQTCVPWQEPAPAGFEGLGICVRQ